MSSFSWKQAAGWAGIASVVIFLIGIFAGSSSPVLGDSAAEFREFFEDNEGYVAWITWSGGLGFALLFLLFASGLRSLLGPADAGNEGVWSRLSFAGAIAFVAIGGVGSSFWAVLGQEDVREGLSDETIKALGAFDSLLFAAVLPWGVAVFIVGASVVILQSGVMTKWLGWLGLLTALLAAVGTLWPFTGDDESFFGYLVFIALILFLIWVLWAAISLIRDDHAPATD